MIEYSKQEQRLIKSLLHEDFLNQEPTITYNRLALYCFSINLQGNLAESVRRCYNAMINRNPHRLTPEFDDLIVITPGRTLKDYLDDNYSGMIY